MLTEGYWADYTSSGQLLFLHEDALWAAPFDLVSLRMTGEPVSVLRDVVVSTNAMVSKNNTMNAFVNGDRGVCGVVTP